MPSSKMSIKNIEISSENYILRQNANTIKLQSLYNIHKMICARKKAVKIMIKSQLNQYIPISSFFQISTNNILIAFICHTLIFCIFFPKHFRTNRYKKQITVLFFGWEKCELSLKINEIERRFWGEKLISRSIIFVTEFSSSDR